MSVSSPEFGSPVLMQEAVHGAEISILDIGAGMRAPYNEDRAIVYVGLNVDPRQHEELSKEVEGPNNFAVYCDLRVFADESSEEYGPSVVAEYRKYIEALFGDCRFDRLGMRNVFGEDTIPNHFEGTSINPSGGDYKGFSDFAAKASSLRIGRFLMKPGAVLMIEETQSPLVGYAGAFRNDPGLLGLFGFMVIDVDRPQGDRISKDAYRITAVKA